MDVNGQKASVGVIAPYRAQVSLLRKMISPALSGSDISTVDQFQGRDKDVIIYSCTKTKANKTAGKISEDTILNDWRRRSQKLTIYETKISIYANNGILVIFIAVHDKNINKTFLFIFTRLVDLRPSWLLKMLTTTRTF